MSDDYLAYQTFDSLQAFFSTITALLANRALLEGLGVGDANSSATFAMLLTILKDAMSRIATIVFAHRFGLRIEPDAKRYRFLADLFNDTAFFIELYSPYFGPWGKVLALSVGEALRALCGVAAGASKAALSVHFAKHDNLAELNAKEASQETAVGLIGLLAGTLVVKFVENHNSVVCLMVLLVLGHLYVNYLGVCSVNMTTLNRQRATVLYSEYIRGGRVLSPKEVAKRENILFWDTAVPNIHGEKVAHIEIAESFEHARSFRKDTTKPYLVDRNMYTLFITRRISDGFTNIRILLWDKAEPGHITDAWFDAMDIAGMLEKGKGYTDGIHRNVVAQNGMEGFAEGSTGFKKPHRRELLSEMPRLGWDFASPAFETGAPVRVRVQPAHQKDE